MVKKVNQNGAVAIVSVVVFAIIITVLITAYLRSAVSQQSLSQSYDFSTRAYYAAESGVQDTISEIRADPAKLANKDSCAPFSSSNNKFGVPDFGLSYNCQLIKVEDTIIKGDVVPNTRSAMVRLEPSVSVANPRLVIRWSESYESLLAKGLTPMVLHPRGTTSKLFTPQSSTTWFRGNQPGFPLHALLRVELIDHPADFNRESISQRVVFLNPTETKNTLGNTVNFSKADNSIDTQQRELFNNAECYKSNGIDSTRDMGNYSCKQVIDLAGYNFGVNESVYVRVASVYRPTEFSVELRDGTDTVVLKNSQASIDITAKAGLNTFRRIRQTVPLQGYQVQYGPDAALIVGEGICKRLSLGINNPDIFKSECNPLTD